MSVCFIIFIHDLQGNTHQYVNYEWFYGVQDKGRSVTLQTSLFLRQGRKIFFSTALQYTFFDSIT